MFRTVVKTASLKERSELPASQRRKEPTASSPYACAGRPQGSCYRPSQSCELFPRGSMRSAPLGAGKARLAHCHSPFARARIMNVKKDEDVFEDESCAFRAKHANTEFYLNRVAFPSGSGLCGPQIEQRNVTKLDAKTIAPVYPRQ